MKKLYHAAFAYVILGLLLGVFYREFTKFSGFEGNTQLSTLHTHSFALGFLFFLIVFTLDLQVKVSTSKGFHTWFWLYNASLVGVIGTMTWRGVIQVVQATNEAVDFKGLSHIAGTFHTLLAISLIWLMLMIGKKIK